MRATKGLRAVLDTNVYLSIFVLPESRMSDPWRLALEGRYTVVISPFIVREFMEKMREKFGVPAEARELIKRKVLRRADIVQPKTVPKVISDDPDDDHILACAVAGEAAIIVSGNKHLLRLKEYEGIPIVRPMDFLRTLGST